MKIIFFANTDWYLYNFRLALIKHVQSLGYDVLLISPPGEYAAKLIRQGGVRWQPLEMDRRSLNPLTEIKVLFNLARIYRKESPDIVHHFTLKCVLYGMLAASVTRIKTKVNAITGLGYIFTAKSVKAKLLKPFVGLVMKLLLKGKNSKVIVQNVDDYNLLRSSDLVSEQSLILIRGSGVDINRFSPLNSRKKDNDKLVVLMATRLLEDKGVREYVQATEEIRKKRKDVAFLLAGEADSGNPSSITEQEITKWKQSSNIELLGHIDDMEDILNMTDIAVLPSYREGLPRILIEAASCATPIVTTDVPGCREIVDHGVNGFLVPEKNVEKLVLSIEILLDSPDLRRSMGLAGRKKVEKYLDERIVINETVKTYQLH